MVLHDIDIRTFAVLLKLLDESQHIVHKEQHKRLPGIGAYDILYPFAQGDSQGIGLLHSSPDRILSHDF